MQLAGLFASIIVLATGCTSSSSLGPSSAADASTRPVAPYECNPLDAPATPLTLSNLLGAGRHSDGTLYVVDGGGRDHLRAFISGGNVLQRVIVSGSGQNPGVLSLSITEPKVSIQIQQPGLHPSSMSIFRGELDGKTFDPDLQGERLELVAADALAAFTVMNVPNNAAVEVNASLADGRRLFVTRPKVDWSYEDFRVFFGPPEAVTERPLKASSSTKSATRFITFEVDGVDYAAVIPAAPPYAQPDVQPTITPAGQPALPLTRLSNEPSAWAGLAFMCIH